MAVDINWILGLAIMFGLSLVLAKLTFNDIESFFVYLSIFTGFVVWGGLLPLWVLVVNLIIIVLMLSNKVKKRVL